MAWLKNGKYSMDDGDQQPYKVKQDKNVKKKNQNVRKDKKKKK